MTRRGLIRRALLILGIVPTGVIGCASRRATGRVTLPVRDAQDPASQLSTAEVENLVAFGEVVVEGRTLALAERRSLVEHLEGRTKRSARYRALYRSAASTLDHLAGGPFASLAVSERVEFIARHRLASAPELQEEDLDPLPAEIRALQGVASDLIHGYYASPAGWAVVGYQTFPGRCGNLTRYTRAES